MFRLDLDPIFFKLRIRIIPKHQDLDPQLCQKENEIHCRLAEKAEARLKDLCGVEYKLGCAVNCIYFFLRRKDVVSAHSSQRRLVGCGSGSGCFGRVRILFCEMRADLDLDPFKIHLDFDLIEKRVF